jgi:hypothetical protein
VAACNNGTRTVVTMPIGKQPMSTSIVTRGFAFHWLRHILAERQRQWNSRGKLMFPKIDKPRLRPMQLVIEILLF